MKTAEQKTWQVYSLGKQELLLGYICTSPERVSVGEMEVGVSGRFKRVKQRSACGQDEVPGPVLKHWPDSLARRHTHIRPSLISLMVSVDVEKHYLDSFKCNLKTFLFPKL